MLPLRTMFYGVIITIGSLIGGLMLGLMIGSLVFEVVSGHNFQSLDPVHVLLAGIPALAGFFIGGAVWGVLMGRLAGATNRRRLAVAGALGFAPITIGLAMLLQVIEPIALEKFGAVIPLHRLFTLLFVPTAFLITGVSTWALGIGLHDKAVAKSLWWRAGLGAAVAFLVIDFGMESAGWVVGAPRAAERFTMLTVLFTSNLGAAIVGGAVVGTGLARRHGDAHLSVLRHPGENGDAIAAG
ncbi:MAG: hypothetical protein HZB51_26290 [Chloroflexi bacterium]|nr:hypothetical protein [Chloroflexota bacterium]